MGSISGKIKSRDITTVADAIKFAKTQKKDSAFFAKKCKDVTVIYQPDFCYVSIIESGILYTRLTPFRSSSSR